MKEIFIPTLHTFAMDNIFTGSCGDFRFRIVPNVVKKTAKEVDMDQSSMQVQCWRGPFCFEKSQIEETKTFPMTQQGRSEMKSWLESCAQ